MRRENEEIIQAAALLVASWSTEKRPWDSMEQTLINAVEMRAVKVARRRAKKDRRLAGLPKEKTRG